MLFEIYTDGACHPNPGKGGWGFVVFAEGNTEEIYHHESGKVAYTTNNKMELKAIEMALLFLIKNPKSCATIFSDSSYCIGMCSKGWRAKKNKEEIKAIRALNKTLNLTETFLSYQWVKGHSGVDGNEIADELAETASKS